METMAARREAFRRVPACQIPCARPRATMRGPIAFPDQVIHFRRNQVAQPEVAAAASAFQSRRPVLAIAQRILHLQQNFLGMRAVPGQAAGNELARLLRLLAKLVLLLASQLSQQRGYAAQAHDSGRGHSNWPRSRRPVGRPGNGLHVAPAIAAFASRSLSADLACSNSGVD